MRKSITLFIATISLLVGGYVFFSPTVQADRHTPEDQCAAAFPDRGEGYDTCLTQAVGNQNAAETPTAPDEDSGVCDKGSFLGLPRWYKYLDVTYSDGKEPDEIEGCNIKLPTKSDVSEEGDGKVTDVGKSAALIGLAVFEIILRIAGIAAVAFTIYGGFQYMLSQGEPDRTKGARSTIINALIGLAIAISATAIINLIGNTLT